MTEDPVMPAIVLLGVVLWGWLVAAIVRCVHEHRSTEQKSAAAYDVEG